MAKSVEGKRVVEKEDRIVYKAAENMEDESNWKEMLNTGPDDSVSRVSYRSQVKDTCAKRILKEVNQAKVLI